jgi:RimJ/RimL family protein N-acetyltransferase
MNAADGRVQPRSSTTVVFETARLVVRRIEHSDAAAMQTVYGDAEAMRWVGDGRPLDLLQCENWIAITHRNYAVRGYGMFAINARASGEVIGFCGLVHPGGQVEAEIKYALGREFWVRGFATEAAAGLLAYGATTHSLVSVIATAAPDNTASHRVLLKAGMQKGTLRPNEDGSFTQLFVWLAGYQWPAQ